MKSTDELMPTVGEAARRLQEAFDGSFALPPVPREADSESLLTLSLGGEPYALRLAQIARLSAGRPLAPLPTTAPGFLGLAGLRGALLPVWDLGALLGYAPLRGQPRWLAAAAALPPWAVAFERFDGFRLALAGELSPLGGDSRAHDLATQLYGADGVLRPVIDLEKVKQAIQRGSLG